MHLSEVRKNTSRKVFFFVEKNHIILWSSNHVQKILFLMQSLQKILVQHKIVFLSNNLTILYYDVFVRLRELCSYFEAFIVWRRFFTLCSSTRPRWRTLSVRKPPDSKACVFSLEAKREEKGATLVGIYMHILVSSRCSYLIHYWYQY